MAKAKATVWVAYDTTGRNEDRDMVIAKVIKSRKRGENMTYTLDDGNTVYFVRTEDEGDRLHFRPEGAYSNRFDIAEVNPNLTEFAEQVKSFDRFDRIQFERFAHDFSDARFWMDCGDDAEDAQKWASHWQAMQEIVANSTK